MAENFSNLAELCEKSCKQFADRPLFATKQGGGWEWTTYGQFKALVDRCRGGLAAIGVGAGDRVAIVANNRVEWAVACYATYGLRAAFVPMYEAQLEKEWSFILADCEAKVVFGSTPAIVDKLRKIQPEVPSLKHIIGFDLPASDAASFGALLAKGDANPTAVAFPDAREIAGFIYTSGTTGMPKGVILSHNNICSNINAVNSLFPHGPEDRSLAFLPWAHSYGQTCELHFGLSSGCSAGLNDEIPNLIANLAEIKPTILLAVPRIFNRIYDGVNKQMEEKPAFIRKLFKAGIAIATRRNLGQSISIGERITVALADKLIFAKIRAKFGGRLKYVMSGSAAMSGEVAEFIDALGIEFYEGYGLSETSPIATVNYPGNRKIGSVGKAIAGVTIKIDTSVVGDEKHGEILIYGPNIMVGYHNRKDENDAVMMPDGGFRSGDLGYLDDEGYLYISGRIKEQYKLENGKYVVPSPLEEKLKLSPFIANVMIHGSNKPVNVALVVPDPEALKRWAADNNVTLTDAATDERVRTLIAGEIEKRTADWKGYEKVRGFILTTEDFTTDNGMLTPTLKLKRRNVMQKYGAALEDLSAQLARTNKSASG